MKKAVAVMILALCLPSARVVADGTTPIQVSGWSPIQVFPFDWDVVGLRCGIYSRNRHVYGLDVGLLNQADASSGGIQVGLMCSTVSGLGVDFLVPGDLIPTPEPDWEAIEKASRSRGAASYTGLQVAFGSNYADDMTGVQLAWIWNVAGTLRGCQLAAGISECASGSGWQLGLADEARHDFSGVQGVALVNLCGGDMHGLQIGGLWNHCDGDMHGLQIGLVNTAARMTGVQIGLVNVIKEGPVPFLPLINAQF